MGGEAKQCLHLLEERALSGSQPPPPAPQNHRTQQGFEDAPGVHPAQWWPCLETVLWLCSWPGQENKIGIFQSFSAWKMLARKRHIPRGHGSFRVGFVAPTNASEDMSGTCTSSRCNGTGAAEQLDLSADQRNQSCRECTKNNDEEKAKNKGN